VNDLAKWLLVEKRIDDFYEAASRENAGFEGDELAEHLKESIPLDERQLLLLWEAQYAAEYGRELRQFAHFCTDMNKSGLNGLDQTNSKVCRFFRGEARTA
jgi:hypothetical protein